MIIQELITYVKLTKFTNDEGKEIKSAEVYALGNYQEKEHDFGSDKGHKFAKLKLPYEVAEKFTKVPALYDINYKTDIDRNHAITIKPIDAILVKEFKIFS